MNLSLRRTIASEAVLAALRQGERGREGEGKSSEYGLPAGEGSIVSSQSYSVHCRILS